MSHLKGEKQEDCLFHGGRERRGGGAGRKGTTLLRQLQKFHSFELKQAEVDRCGDGCSEGELNFILLGKERNNMQARHVYEGPRMKEDFKMVWRNFGG